MPIATPTTAGITSREKVVALNYMDSPDGLSTHQDGGPQHRSEHHNHRSPHHYAGHHLPLHWLQPKGPSKDGSNDDHEEEDVLPSFRDVQQKTHRTLYGGGDSNSNTGHSAFPPSRDPSAGSGTATGGDGTAMWSATAATTGRSTGATTASRSPPPPTPPDKSPKGSVDAPIQHLVDLINHHSHFCTLSSCSGRISLFDPNGIFATPNKSSNDDGRVDGGDDEDGDGLIITERDDNSSMPSSPQVSGKGIGGWVLVSHEKLDPQALVDCFEGARTTASSSSSAPASDGGSDAAAAGGGDDRPPTRRRRPWMFKFEPLLLHVAAASARHGRHLLRSALELGFRESGLVVTDSRVTVAIRGHSLALATPLWPPLSPRHSNNSSESRPSLSSSDLPPAFLRALVEECNQRMEQNWKQLERLYGAIESTLFEIRRSPPPIRIMFGGGHASQLRRLDDEAPEEQEEEEGSARSARSADTSPPLNLWNATAIVATREAEGGNPCQVGGQQSESQAHGQPHVYVVGGYGCGPTATTHSDETKRGSAARRSDQVYKLERRCSRTRMANSNDESESGEGQALEWVPVPLSSPPSDSTSASTSSDGTTFWHISTAKNDRGPHNRGPNEEWPATASDPKHAANAVLEVSYLDQPPDLQGMTSCRLKESGLVILWGGRRSPTRPIPADTIYLFHDSLGPNNASESQQERGQCWMAKAVDVRGGPALPRPRWGHGLVALSGNRALLIGGCNQDDGAMDDLFLLHLCTEGGLPGHHGEHPRGRESLAYFCWEQLSVRLPSPRFHFASTIVGDDDTVVVFGGLGSTHDILQVFEERTASASKKNWWACRVGETKEQDEPSDCHGALELSSKHTRFTIVTTPHLEHPEAEISSSYFGMACCTFLSKHLFLVTGGVHTTLPNPTRDQSDAPESVFPIQAFWVSNKITSKQAVLHIQRVPLLLENKGGHTLLEFGSMLHHSCITISSNEVLFVGGGVQSFAFGECYSE